MGVAPRRARGQSDPAQEGVHARPRIAQAHPVGAKSLGHLVADADDRVERVHRALEHHGHAAPAHLAPERLVRERAEVPTLELDAAGGHRRVPGQEAHEREREAGLAAARLPDDAHRLARPVHGQRQPVDRADRPSRTGVLDHEPFDGQQRHAPRRSRGWTMGSMAMARSMNVTAVMMMSSPGDITHHQ